MKTIFKSLFVIAAVAVIAGGATYSYFSSNIESRNNTFATGTLRLNLGTPANINIGDMQPGDTEEGTVVIKNDGSLVARDVKMKVEKHGVFSPGPNLCDALQFTTSPNPIPDIAANGTKTISVTVKFPDTHSNQNFLQDKTCSFDLSFEARAYTN
jgi:predicted ribosomally synthesized peptide with SipW-like signal peptide